MSGDAQTRTISSSITCTNSKNALLERCERHARMPYIVELRVLRASYHRMVLFALISTISPSCIHGNSAPKRFVGKVSGHMRFESRGEARKYSSSRVFTSASAASPQLPAHNKQQPIVNCTRRPNRPRKLYELNQDTIFNPLGAGNLLIFGKWFPNYFQSNVRIVL